MWSRRCLCMVAASIGVLGRESDGLGPARGSGDSGDYGSGERGICEGGRVP